MKKGTGMRKVISVFLTLGVAALLPQGLCGCFAAWAMEDAKPEYRFADAGEAAVLLLSNEDYYDNLTQDDLNYRMQGMSAIESGVDLLPRRRWISLRKKNRPLMKQWVRSGRPVPGGDTIFHRRRGSCLPRPR